MRVSQPQDHDPTTLQSCNNNDIIIILLKLPYSVNTANLQYWYTETLSRLQHIKPCNKGDLLIAICNTLINGLIFLTLCTLLHQRNASKWNIHCSSVEFGTDTTAQWLRYMKQTSTKDISSSQ